MIHPDISKPYYGRRSVVPMPSAVLMSPQTHQAAIGDGAGTVSGVVRDSNGAVIPGATVQLVGPSGPVATSVTQQATSVTGQIEKARQELAVLIASVTFELPATAPPTPSPR